MWKNKQTQIVKKNPKKKTNEYVPTLPDAKEG